MKLIRSILAVIATILIVFVAVSLLDLLITTLYPAFYTRLMLVVTFAVGGIFAAVSGYMFAMEQAEEKNETIRWVVIDLLLLSGILFFFFLAKIEEGAYKAAFKAFGATLTLGSLFFVTDKET